MEIQWGSLFSTVQVTSIFNRRLLGTTAKTPPTKIPWNSDVILVYHCMLEWFWTKDNLMYHKNLEYFSICWYEQYINSILCSVMTFLGFLNDGEWLSTAGISKPMSTSSYQFKELLFKDCCFPFEIEPLIWTLNFTQADLDVDLL